MSNLWQIFEWSLSEFIRQVVKQMAITTTKVLRLTFNTTGGKTFMISLANPREDLTRDEIETVMDTIISRNVFLTSSGELSLKRDAKIVNTSTNDLYDAPLS